jgi:hypothetical protein
MPILNRINGEHQDLSHGAPEGLGALLIFLAVSWTLAAVGEEIVYRSYLTLRISDMFGANTVGILAVVCCRRCSLGSPTQSEARSGSFSRFSMRFLQPPGIALQESVGGRPWPRIQQPHWSGQLLSCWPNVWTVVASNGR